LLESAITARGGFVERTAGDSFFALFGDPVQAVGAAVDARRSLSGHRWPERVGELRVRMGLHTGMVDRSERELIGLDIHLAARVEAAANGGQIVVSEATRDAVAGRFSVQALGLHRV
jgi:class 3 adenylate cyclase